MKQITDIAKSDIKTAHETLYGGTCPDDWMPKEKVDIIAALVEDLSCRVVVLETEIADLKIKVK